MVKKFMQGQRLVIALILVFVSALPTLLTAQDTDQSGQNSLLPEIDPQDIEIRGEFTARFPGLRRQPILGFNPTPRVYRIDPQRMPFMESGEQIIANLSVSELARPAAPDTQWYQLPKRNKAWVYGGFGMLTTAEVRAIYDQRTDQSAWLADVGYTQSAGHLENDESGYRLAGATVGKEWIMSGGRRSAILLDAVYDDHDLFTYGLSSSPAQTEWLSTSASYQSTKRKSAVDVFDWNIGLRWSSHNMDANNTTYEESIREASLNMEKSFAANTINTVISWSLDGQFVQQLTDTDASESVYYGKAGLAYERLASYNFQWYAELAGGYASDELSGGQFVVLPQVDITYWINDRMQLRSFLESNITQLSSFQQRSENRFLGVNSRPATELKYRGGIAYSWDISTKFSFEAGGAYNHWRDKRYYVLGVPATGMYSNALSSTYYQAEYADADEYSLWSALTFRIDPDWAWVTVRPYWQDHQRDNGEAIPYREKWGVELSSSLSFGDSWQINIWGHWKGPRLDAVSGSNLDGFMLAGAQLEYYVSDQIGFYIKGQNLIDQQYQQWYGYKERPLTLLGGVSAHF